MDFIIGIIAFVVMLSVIVILHELGHFLVAKHFGVYCKEFSIGMGPCLYQKQGKETAFSIRAIPFGGFVMMAGEEDGSQSEEDSWLKDVPENRRLNGIEKWKQVCIMIAGIVMNILLAWIIYMGVALAQGYVIEDAKPVVYVVEEDSVAQKAGLEKDDHIVKVQSEDGNSIQPKTQNEILEFIQYHHDTLTLTIKRDGTTFETTLTPSYDKDMEGYTLGYKAIAYAKKIPWYQSLWIGCQNTWDSAITIFKSLNMIIHGQGLENLSGPVGILNVTSKSVQYGLDMYFSLFAMISLNIGIFNAIPIPALDGGRILILLIEKLIGRKVSTKVVENIIMASFVLLMLLFLYATYNDIVRLF